MGGVCSRLAVAPVETVQKMDWSCATTGESGWERFRSLLNEQYDWPTSYTFKFIVPRDQLSEVEAVFADDERRIRESTRGRYCSVTVVREVASAEDVIAVYSAAGEIEGIVSL